MISSENPKLSCFELRVKKYLDHSQVGLLFIAGQKYVCVGSGSISTVIPIQNKDSSLKIFSWRFHLLSESNESKLKNLTHSLFHLLEY